MVQAGEQPGIGDDGQAPPAYAEAGQLLEPFLQRTGANTHIDHPDWFFLFHTPEALKHTGRPSP